MKKAMALLPVLLIALSVVGFAYAHWDDTVQIEGTAYMGEFIVGILDESWSSFDNEDEFIPIKEVAECYIEVADSETSVHHEPPETVWKTMYVTVDNAYPNYINWIKFNLKNAGTIPAHIKSVTVEDLPGNCELVWQKVDCAWEGKDPDTGEPVINLRIYKQETLECLESNQIEPCTCLWVEIEIEFKQAALECHTYDFKITIYAIQWNKN